MRPHLPHVFYVAGGTLGVENALKAAFDWKVRKNFARGYRKERGTQVLHFEQSFHGRSGYTLSLTNTAEPKKTALFPKFDWPRVLNPKVEFPLNEARLKDVKARETLSIAQMSERSRTIRTTSPRSSSSRSRARGATTISVPSFYKSCGGSRTSTRRC